MKIKNFPISQGVTVVTIGCKKNRCTIAYRRVNRMVQVAVSYCAPDDKWNAKTGRDIVLDRVVTAIGCHTMDGVVSLPIAWMVEEQLQAVLQLAFFDFLNQGA